MAPPQKTFQLLELNIISAQDLEPVSRKMKTYAMAWMNPRRKLSSCVDAEGHNNPTWNDKFVFRVEEEFLRRDTSAVMIEIHSVNWFRHVLVGTVRVLIGNLVPPPGSRGQQNGYIGMRFLALQVRRPSGRPQGILNIGVTLLDPSMRSMPLYTQPAMSAVGYRDLMEDPLTLPHFQPKENTINNNDDNQASGLKPILRRTRSDRSEMMGLDNFSPSSSMIMLKGKTKAKESSILSMTECMVPLGQVVKKAGKASSVISGAELREKPKQRGKKSKASSVVNASVPGTDSKTGENRADESTSKANNASPSKDKLTIGKPTPPRNNGYLIGAPFKKGSSILSDSEVGPSPSEVAAAVMAQRRFPLDDKESSVLDGWSMDESVEGLRSKLDRWRMELPPLYDRSGFSTSSYRSSSDRTRKGQTKEEDGVFSCFGNIFGYECQCICGKPPGKKGGGSRFHSTSSSPGRSSFI